MTICSKLDMERECAVNKLTSPFSILLMCFMFSACAPSNLATTGNYTVEQTSDLGMAKELVINGEYKNALAEYRRVYEEFQRNSNETGMLFCLEKIGWLYRETGAYEEALRAFNEAYELGVRLNGDAAEIDAHIGDVYQFSGDVEKAEEHYRRAIETLKDYEFPTSYLFPPGKKELSEYFRKNAAIIHARDLLGVMYYFKGDYEEALENLLVAEELIKKIDSVVNHGLYGKFVKLDSDFQEGIGYCRTTLGATYGRLGRFDEAGVLFNLGREAFEKGGRRFGLLFNKALQLDIEMYRPGAVIDQQELSRFEEVLDEARGIGALDITWRLKAGVGEYFVRSKDYRKAKKYLAEAIDLLENTRAGIREDAMRKMFAASTSVQQVYGLMIETCFALGEYSAGFDYLERAKARSFLDILAGRSVKVKNGVNQELAAREKDVRQRIEVLQRKLRAQGEQGRSETNEKLEKLLAEWQGIVEKIKKQDLEFASTRATATAPIKDIISNIKKKEALISYFTSEDKTFIWVVKGERISAAVSEVKAFEISGMTTEFRRAITSLNKSKIKVLGNRLSEILIAPVESELAGVDSLYIVPSQPMHYLPFSCLPLKTKGAMIDKFTLSFLPNASSLFYLTGKASQSGRGAGILGNPERPEPGASLKFAEIEAKTIAEIIPSSRILVGSEATETSVKEIRAPGFSILHIAAHGVYDRKKPLDSALLLAADDRNDGNLKTGEVFNLDFIPGLVVLSACESGIGKVQGGGEVQSMNRAFLYAGAEGVMASLWNVADKTTYELMKIFYLKLKDMTPAEALREAQLKIRRKYPDPFYWAPFYFTGGVYKHGH